MKILHVLPTLGMGGAERLASELAARSPAEIEHLFVSMLSEPPFFPMAARVESLGLRRGQFSPKAALAFRSLVRREAPDIVQGWLYHGNILASLVRDLGPAILWSIHNTSLDLNGSKTVTRGLNRVAALISSWVPDRIVYCAEEARRLHEAAGYRRTVGCVIPNGVDLSRFKPSSDARERSRAAWSLHPGDVAIGQFGRLDPQKGLPTLLAAFRALLGPVPSARLVLAGSGFDATSGALVSHLTEMSLADRVVLLGSRRDMPEVLAGIDVLVMASGFGEALPMIAIEGAAMDLPVVTTSVGEAKRLALSLRHVVPPEDPAALAEAIEAALSDRRNQGLSAALARRRSLLQETFGIERMVSAYAALYRSCGRRK